MTLNAPREIPYEFRVFEMEGAAWLYDESSRTYICCATPSYYAEPLYWLDGREELLPDGDYFSRIPDETIPVPVEAGADIPEREAWDDAREEACGNCLL